MDLSALIPALPIEQRLALAYASASTRPLFLGLLALDARLAAVVRQASDPMLGQIRLAWWRDRLNVPPDSLGRGEPLLELLELWDDERSALVGLVDGWELLLEPQLLGTEAIEQFIHLRAAAWEALARRLDVLDTDDAIHRAATGWAIADTGGKLSDPIEVERARALAADLDWRTVRLRRSMRPLAVLYGLARRNGGQGEFLTGPLSGLVAVRLGLLGF